LQSLVLVPTLPSSTWPVSPIPSCPHLLSAEWGHGSLDSRNHRL
jgi:hypothetical protein